jgi:signal transduction histidine kinase
MRVEPPRPTELDSARAVAVAGGLGERIADDVTVASPQMRDLAALLALPRMWRDRDTAYIVGSLLDVLTSLLRCDAAYVTLTCGRDGSSMELWRPSDRPAAKALGRAQAPSALTGAADLTVSDPAGVGNVRLLRLPAQLDDQDALVVVSSTRGNFPTDLESFLCRVAVEQAMLAVHASRLVASLRTANAAKATFLATMSHELRTPLNAVIGYAELLQAQISGDLNTQQQQHIHRIDVAARHLLGLIEGILNFARLEAGKEQVHIANVNAAQLSAGVVELVEPLAHGKGLALRVTVPQELPLLRTDHSKVRQILLNLLSNAVKFTTEGAITLEVRADDADMEWAVSDTGVGIAAGDLNRVFEPFQQAGESHSGRAPGTGLGLSVSRQLARLLGGDVTAESTPGVGSRFVLRLPLRPDTSS